MTMQDKHVISHSVDLADGDGMDGLVTEKPDRFIAYVLWALFLFALAIRL